MTMPGQQGRLAAYAAGNKVYGGGRPHPTSGPVDPTGYVERSANGEASNRRSGLAAAAQRRMGVSPVNSGKTSGTSGAAQRRVQQTAQPVEASRVKAPPSMFSPIKLTDGRSVAPDATGRFKMMMESAPDGY